jgi:hypothetical protein
VAGRVRRPSSYWTYLPGRRAHPGASRRRQSARDFRRSALGATPPDWTVRTIADETTIPRSVVHRAIKRPGAAGLFNESLWRVNISQSEEFLIHACGTCFRRGSRARPSGCRPLGQLSRSPGASRRGPGEPRDLSLAAYEVGPDPRRDAGPLGHPRVRESLAGGGASSRCREGVNRATSTLTP